MYMKTSKRYLYGTLLACLAVPVLIVFYSRFLAPAREAYVPERTPAAELAALRDFTSIVVEGDFALEITEAANYAFTYEAPAESRGELVATVEDGVLRVRGFGNRSDVGGSPSRVRIAAPELSSIDVSYTPSLRISGLSVESLALRALQIRAMTVADNTIGNLQVRSIVNGPVEFEGNTIMTTTLTVVGGESVITTRN
jgi:hypothetical protein